MNILENKLSNYIINVKRPIVILCIGSMKVLMDSYGPKVGSLLNEYINNEFLLNGSFPNKIYYIYGTINKPIHALNILDMINSINRKIINPYIIAIDSCLGDKKDIGKIKILNKSIQLGKGVGKDLIKIGNLSIIAILGEDTGDVNNNYNNLINCDERLLNNLIKKTSNTIYNVLSNI